MVLKVEGMTCVHCLMTVEKAVKEVPGVASVHVDLLKKEVDFAGEADVDRVKAAIQGAGYTVVD